VTFIAFEGGEGGGKSSQIALLAQALSAAGHRVVRTHEPGATPLGQHIRGLLLDSDRAVSARSEALLFAADRAHHVATVIRPALERGEIVITDRYVDSSLAYQGAGRTLATEDVRRLSDWATDGLRPDLTVLLDLAPLEGLRRARGRDGETGLDRLEREDLTFHERVREEFLRLAEAEPARYLTLDATRPMSELAGIIHAVVTELIEARP
jgi:dTMP kinase